MARKSHRAAESAARVSRAWPIVFACALLFTVLAALPAILPALHLELHPSAPQTSYGVKLMVAPQAPRAVHVPAVAEPITPNEATATLPTVNAAREAAMVATEDKRLRTVLHVATSLYQPEVVSLRGSLPTLVLTAASSAYTAQTLVEYGAMVLLPNHAALLIDNIYVSANATLDLSGSNLRTLYLDSGSGGFATIVGWGGNLAFAGTAAHPMTIIGWDRDSNTPAADAGYGRPYIREVGGKMTLSDVRASYLGFWSGRTGGIAWTGLTGSSSTGNAVNSTFTDDTYGSFVSRGSGVTFRNDLFEYNQLDGLHVHRYSVNTSATSSSAVRNGGNGFVVSPATQSTLLEGDIAEHNAGNGFLLDGQPLATGASASGGSVSPGTGTSVEYSAALDNAKTGVLVEGGLDPVVKGDQVCGGATAIELKGGSSDAVVTGNTISCAPRSGISVGPSAPGTVLSGNAVEGARIAFLISASGPVQLDKNVITGATVFGVSARGASSTVSGVGNTIAGSGFRAVDSSADAPSPSLYASNLGDWTYHVHVTFWSYLQFHPLAALWLGIATLILVAFLWSKRRRAPSHPYLTSTRWRPESTQVAAAAASPHPEPVSVAPAASTARPGRHHGDSTTPPGEFSRRRRPAAFDPQATRPQPAFEPQPAYHAAPTFDPQPTLEPQPSLDPQPAHDATPAYQFPPAYSAQPHHDPRPAHDPQPAHDAPPAFDPLPAYDLPAIDDPPAPQRDGGSRPPWNTIGMPRLDDGEQKSDQSDVFSPRGRTVDAVGRPYHRPYDQRYSRGQDDDRNRDREADRR